MITIIVIVMAMTTALFGGNSGTQKTNKKTVVSQKKKALPKYISVVKNGHFKGYTNKTIGKAFDSYFTGPSWTQFKSQRGWNVVEFRGRGLILKGKGKTVFNVQFIVNSNGSFHVANYTEDGVTKRNLTGFSRCWMPVIYRQRGLFTLEELINMSFGL